jgi:S-methylmethionine-dependent homocysteine/selenocysteine methylase
VASFADRLARGPLVLDGGLATELERLGHDLGGSLWSARLLRDHPEDIEAVHRAYYAAGADVAITATYQASFEGFARAGAGREETARLLRLGVELARRARDAVRPDGLVAASVGPYGVVLADGSEYTGDYGGVRPAQLAAVHRPRVEALLAAGPDVLAFETIPAIGEAAALVDLLGEYDGVAAWITFCCRDGAALSDGTPIEDAVRLVAGSGRLTALGVNCTAPEHIGALLGRMRAVTDLPLLVYPNSGRVWDGERRAWHGAGVAGFPPGLVAGWVERGARGVGGCCGIDPAGIAGVAGVLAP